MIALQFVFSEVSTYWPPIGIYVGSFLIATPSQRYFLVVLFAVASASGNAIISPLTQMNFYFVIWNGLEALTILSCIFIMLYLITGTIPGEIDLIRKKHLISFCVGVVGGCLITANGGSLITM